MEQATLSRALTKIIYVVRKDPYGRAIGTTDGLYIPQTGRGSGSIIFAEEHNMK